MKGGGTYHVASLVFPGPKPIIGWDHRGRVTFRTKEGRYWLGENRPDRTDLMLEEIDPPNQSQASQSLKNNQKPL